MGRLFWKFFLFFFFAQLATAIGVGAFVQFKANDAFERGYLDQSPFSKALADAAESTLKIGGDSALKALLESWEKARLRHRVYVLDKNHKEILNRQVKQEWLSAIETASNQLFQSAVREVASADGEVHTIFVIFSSFRSGPPRHHAKPRLHKRMHPGLTPLPENAGQPSKKQFIPPPRKLTHKRFINMVQAFPIQALFVAAFASALFAAMLAWYFSKPINSLRNAFQRAAEGDLNVRVAGQMGAGKDELSDLGKHFDYMASQINALLTGQKRLLHHVSHELRSPLARMHMALGLALQDKNKTASSLKRIELEANRMDKLISELLELSRFESGMIALDKTPFTISSVLRDIVDDASFEANDQSINIQLEETTGIQVVGQQDLLHRAIENVVRNAVKYSPKGGTIYINTQLNAAHKCVLAVSDEGGGVLATELQDIFKPFVRGHAGSQVKGHGVGLAIAKQIIEAHQGTITAENLAPSGFKIEITLPTSD